MFEQIDIENLTFWSSYYYNMFAPFVNLFVSMAFNSIVIKKVYNIIKSKINLEENIPTE